MSPTMGEVRHQAQLLHLLTRIATATERIADALEKKKES